MIDTRYLRKLSFPQCASEALQCIEQLLASALAGRAIVPRPMDLAAEIITEFVFVERRSHSNDKLTSIQELQLLEVLCNYFGSGNSANDCVWIAVFLLLFPSEDTSRAPLLVKLVSIAIATRSRSVLTATGMWLQQSGVTAKCSLTLAQGLVNDYFVLVPEAVQRLQDLPAVAPLFTVNFLSAVAELYGGQEALPPPALLTMMTSWISRVPGLCTTALEGTRSSPLGTITMPPTTPFAGLFRWCILAPLRGASDKEPYSQLHLALMESAAVSSVQRIGVVPAQDLAAIVPAFQRLAPQADDASVQKALDRMGQAVLLFLHNQSVYGNINELFKQLDALPSNRLLEIVKTKFRGG